MTADPVNLLWTGGWDSTFRLLDVVLRHRAPVQPWYVVDSDRASTPTEIGAMEEIVEAVRERDPGAASQVLPTRTFTVEQIRPDPGVTALHSRLGIGSQYDWLARLAQQEGVDDLELGAVKGGGNMHRLLWGSVEPVEGKAGPTYRLRPAVERPELELFRRFEFPILDLAKVDIRDRSAERGWSDLMEMTWFCHEPRGGRPCGNCTTCLVAVKAGMSRQIPPLRRIRPRLRLLKKALLN